MTWLLVHLFYLVGFQNRLLVLIRWSISFATRGRGMRLITSADQGADQGPTGATDRRDEQAWRRHQITRRQAV